jgi:hypothetical protein
MAADAQKAIRGGDLPGKALTPTTQWHHRLCLLQSTHTV